MLPSSCPPLLITSVNQLDTKLVPWKWEWAETNKKAIDDNWKLRKKKQPSVFNGRVLLARDVVLKAESASMKLFEVDYAQLLGALDLQAPEYTIWNAFAMGALQGSDGHYICGVMGTDTVNANRVYFPAGTPDREDCREDGTVDMPGSLLRELEEETGLKDGFSVEEQWLMVQCWPALALIRRVRFDLPAQIIANKIEKNLKKQDNPELSETRVIRSRDDIAPTTMPRYLQAFFEYVL